MQRAIVCLVVSVMLLTFPSLINVMQTSLGVVSEPGTLGAVSEQIQSSMKEIIDMMSALSYIMGIGFAVKSALLLKQVMEEGEVYIEPQVKVKQELKTNDIYENKSISINDKKIELIIEEIKNKSDMLLRNSQINNEIELKHIAEKSVSAYLPKVINIYTAISPELRMKKVKGGLSAHEMTCQQLELIYSGLCDIELKLLSKDHDKLKVSGKFLSQIFKKKDKAEKVIELEM